VQQPGVQLPLWESEQRKVSARSDSPGAVGDDPGRLIDDAHRASVDEEDRLGELVGQRVKMERPSGNRRTIYEPSTMLFLPDCPAFETLSGTYACLTGSSGLIESWVNSVMGDLDRSSCFGPTAVARAAKKLNTEVHYCEGMPHDGELRIRDGRRIALIPSSGGHSRRERFTLAHELGHAALYELDPDLDQSGPGVDRLCDLFAGELLMPTKFVQMIWRETTNADAIVRLAYQTSTSLSASCVRIAEYLGSATTGLASADGSVSGSYGAKLASSYRVALANACKITPAGRPLMIVQNGLIVSTRGVANGRVVFLIRRQSERVRFWQDAGRSRPSGSGVRGHVFISYVREDSERVDELQRRLQAAGIPVWRDTCDLWPGEDWRAKIRRAITDNALVFIACFSRASLARSKSYYCEELTLAIEQLRLRPADDAWLIPVRLDDCEVPDRDIGGGRTLTSIQRADLFGDHIGEGTNRIVDSILRILRQSDPRRDTNDTL
jgi:hypothetical protein